jgi:hypothetical protein
MSSEMPHPTITIEQGKQVFTWNCCKCNQPLGQFSAQRSIDLHGVILCGECAQKENPVYQEWVREQEMLKFMQEA